MNIQNTTRVRFILIGLVIGCCVTQLLQEIFSIRNIAIDEYSSTQQGEASMMEKELEDLKQQLANLKSNNILKKKNEDNEEKREKVLDDKEKDHLQQQQLPENVCDVIHSLHSSSPMSIWKDFLTGGNKISPDFFSIYWASKHKYDYTQSFLDFNNRLLYYLSPQRLQTTIKSIPRNKQMDKVGRILDIAFKRYQYVQQKKNGVIFPDDYKEPRKVQILVMGGSVTMGIMCSNFNPVGRSTKIHRQDCAWPGRVFDFLNHLFPDVVEGYNIAMGGTNTKVGTDMLKYNLLPDNVPQQLDIIIHAYSTNDMHISTVQDAESEKLTLDDMVHNMYEKFIRTVLKPRFSCDEKEPPLLLFLDDYLGNEQREIRKTLSVNTIGNRLSVYYGLGFMSYADAVRDFVYGDTDEWWFSSKLWPERQIHPGAGAHISIMYVVVYNFLNMATTYCDRLEIGPEHLYDSNVYGMPELRSNQTYSGEPRPKFMNALPPEMTLDLSLDDISMKWHEAENASLALAFNASECTPTSSIGTPCIFSWLSQLLNEDQQILELAEPYLTLNNGWEQTSDHGKIGLTPTSLDAKLSLRFNMTNEVKKLNFVVMKSYGEKWAGSKIEVKVSILRDGKHEAPVKQSMEIEGFHSKNTSESFIHYIDLDEHSTMKGDELTVDVKLVGGTTFKIMGMMFCNF